jgi:hypothetical protein
MPLDFSRIKAILKSIVSQPEGLHFAMFLPIGPGGVAEISDNNPWEVNRDGLITTLRIYGLGHSSKGKSGGGALSAADLELAADNQVELWKQGIAEIEKSFRQVEKAARERTKRPVSLSRLVLDVEVGGVLYAALEGNGWIFAATLNQQSMNEGGAEKQLAEIVEKVLHP